MEVKVDVGVSNLSKEGEEVCGDTTDIIKNQKSTTAILSDGLGSGIKASILSILSTEITSRLIETNLEIKEVFKTIADTLPIRKARGLAYSTLSILNINNEGKAHLIEFDNPSLIIIRDNEMLSLEKEKRVIAGKEVSEAFFDVELEDVLIMVSDGVINAGVGGLFPLGLGEDRLIEKILPINMKQEEAQTIADKIMDLTDAFYLSQPGDDSTSIIMKPRKPKKVVVLTGPPENEFRDKQVVDKFTQYEDFEKVVCGGTTSQIVARELNKEIKTSLDYIDSSVPPTASIEGIDVVTEGILTLNKTMEKLKNVNNKNELESQKEKDGATILARTLLEADQIHFLVGKSVNPAHEDLMKSMQIKPRTKTVGEIVNELRNKGKKIEVEKC